MYALALLCFGTALAAGMLWPKPAAVFLWGTGLSAGFGALVLPSRVAGPAYARRTRRIILLGCMSFALACATLAWKYHGTAPAISRAAFLTLPLTCLAGLVASLLSLSNRRRH